MWFISFVSVPAVIGLSLFILACLYVHHVKTCLSFWRRFGVVSMSPKTIFGDLRCVLFGDKNVPSVYDAIYKAFPDEKFVGIYDLLAPNLLVRDPQLIGTIMVKDFGYFQDRASQTKRTNRLDYHLLNLCGEQWKTVRTKLVPTFSTNKLKGMIPMIDHCANILGSNLREKTLKEEPFEAKEMGSRFSLDVIGCCVFGLHFNTLNQPESEYRKIGKLLITPSIKTAMLQFLRFAAPKLLEFFNISELPAPILPFFLKLLKENEEFRRKELTRRNDMMQLMLDIRDKEQIYDTFTSSDADAIMFNDDVILSNMLVFYVAGYETTASTLSYCLYELALNADIQRKLREEIQTSLEANNGVISYEMLKQLTYTEMVLSGKQ